MCHAVPAAARTRLVPQGQRSGRSPPIVMWVQQHSAAPGPAPQNCASAAGTGPEHGRYLLPLPPPHNQDPHVERVQTTQHGDVNHIRAGVLLLLRQAWPFAVNERCAGVEEQGCPRVAPGLQPCPTDSSTRASGTGSTASRWREAILPPAAWPAPGPSVCPEPTPACLGAEGRHLHTPPPPPWAVAILSQSVPGSGHCDPRGCERNKGCQALAVRQCDLARCGEGREEGAA